MSAHLVIACDAQRSATDTRRCTNGKSEPAGVPPAVGPMRKALRASGWRSVRIRHIMPFLRADGTAGTTRWSTVKDYCPEHHGQIPKPADRVVKHPLYDPHHRATLEES